MSCRGDTELVEKALERYEGAMGVKINRNKSSGLRIRCLERRSLSNPEFSLVWQLIRNGLSLNVMAFRDD